MLFKQDRYGLDGRKIKVWKFRSMTVTENANKVTQARKGDARITNVGAFIRRTSLDELPQFFNVLKGDMSVVDFTTTCRSTQRRIP
ncbi:sugar transferase [Shewanella phaeophyticola]|uniref:sugar transferase n=1 Tax=Shewanella phaeophyticola TaxID=2978345 RepID=UPI0028F6E34A|nr:sugar transferase [Shewanella sp. KJ10-1]